MPDVFARWGIFIDWSNDGAYTQPIDDISRDVLSITWSRGAAGPFASGNEGGGAVIQVKNLTNKYSDMNVASPLNGKLKPGRAVWVKATFDAVAYPVFAGYVREITPSPSDIPLEKRATIVCDDAFARWGRHGVDLALSDSRSLIGMRTAVLDAMSVAAGRRELAPEVEVIPSSESVGQNAGALLSAVNEAGLGSHSIRPTTDPANPWKYTSYSRHHKLDASPDVTLTYRSTNRDLGFDELTGWKISDDAIINRQEVRPYQDPLADSDVDVIIRADDVASQATHDLRAGSEIRSDWIAGASEAGGVAEHLVWRLSQPRQRPAMVLENRWALMFSRDVLDVLAVTDDRVPITARRMEIVGLQGTWGPGAYCRVVWSLQDCPEQSPTVLFTVGRDQLNGAASLGR